MAYVLKKSDGTPLVTIQDGTTNTSATSLTLIGRNTVNFGQAVNQNLVSLLENFSNTTPPKNALVGQLWYNKNIGLMTVYNGSGWYGLVPPMINGTGTAVATITSQNIDVLLTFAQNKLISVATYATLSPSTLPDFVSANGAQYYFARLFPQGLRPGINLVTDPNYYIQFVGNATSANALSTSRQISITGAMTGNVMFDGSSNVNLKVSFTNVYVDGTGNVSIGNANAFSNTANVSTIAGTYTKVIVNDGGQIIGGGNILNSDIINALGYIPYNGSNINTAAQGNTIVARDANGNFSANIMIGTATQAFALANPVMIGIAGDLYGAVSFDGSSNVTIQSNLAVVSNLVAGTYNTVNVDNKGRVIGGSVVDTPPLGSMILYQQSYIPNGWAICNGQSVSTPTGIVDTPDLSNVTVGGAFYIMRVA